MNKIKLQEQYYNWLCAKVFSSSRYEKLMTYLNNTDFQYTISLDGNRAEDGINLRYEFGNEIGCNQAIINSYLDDRQCSMLEMMVALSVRCEEHIMSNSEFGDRTGTWFWGMIKNLGLHTLTDAAFKQDKADTIINRFLSREYSPTGIGGLFTVNCGHDLRSTEIWYQMCWYLDTICKGE